MGFALLFAICMVGSARADRAGFTTIDVPGNSGYTEAFGINPEGDIVGGFGNPSNSILHGFLLSKGAFTAIDVPGAYVTEARGISPKGDIVGFFSDVSGVHGFLLSKGSFTTIDVPGASGTEAFGIDSEGDIVGYYNNGGVHGFLLRK
jgi:uncharacterized membrane protein